MKILPTVALLALVLASPAAGQGSPTPKISEDILYHARVKARPAGVDPEQHARAVRRLGLDEERLDTEACVLYVHRRLAAAEIEELRPAGIEIDADDFVPAVPGRHPYGFHFGIVRYDALDVLAADPRFARVGSIEVSRDPLNDLGTALVHVDDVHAGVEGTPRDGTGVKVAVADSGLDSSHPDLPTPVEAYDVTDGFNVATWGTDVTNTVTDHGTHVVGTALGDGSASGGTYSGGAPGASLYFYKIGNDCDAKAQDADIMEALLRAVALDCDVFSMSYGGLSGFLDGSESVEQTADWASSQGMVVVFSAGNDGNTAKHDSMSVAPGATSATFTFTVSNAGGTSPTTAQEQLQVLWIDEVSLLPLYNVSLSCSNLGAGESLTLESSDLSARGTKRRTYSLSPNIAAGAAKTYQLQFTNTGPATFPTPLVHVYRTSGAGTFDSPDASTTVGSPAVADTAIAVGAWCHRNTYIDSSGIQWWSTQTVGTPATFSARGPRIDGVQKPDVVAPGTLVVSTLDSSTFTCPACPAANCLGAGFPSPAATIDDDGVLGGSAQYYVKNGTSMAAPLVAGIAALLLEEDPSLTSAKVRTALNHTAKPHGYGAADVGQGLVDALDALRVIEKDTVWVDFDHDGTESGTYFQPWNTITEALSGAGAAETIRIFAGSTAATPTLEGEIEIEAWGGAVEIGG